MQVNTKYIFVTLLLFISCTCTFAQQDTKLTLPSSPAFSILNVEPSAVMKPTSNKDLGADILNAFDKDGKLQTNLGLEVSPYWLKSRPTLTRSQYLNPTVSQCFLQSLNLSGATVKDSVTGKEKLGVGLRFKLFNGQATNDYLVKEKQLNQQLNITNTIGVAIALVGVTIHSRDSAIIFLTNTLSQLGYNKTLIDTFKSQAQALALNYDDTNAGITTFLKAIVGQIINANNTLITQVADLSKKRVGFILEFASAAAFNSGASSNALNRVGFWANASNYFTPSDAWTISARYMFANRDSAITNFDAGISYLKELPDFNISVEGMLRWYRMDFPDKNSVNQPITRVEKSFTYRLSVQGSYKIASNVSFNISLGKDFDSPTISGSSFFSLFGFNYSLFRSPKVDLAKN